MDGIVEIKQEKYTVIYVEKFSEELKLSIRNNLSAICHGGAAAETKRLSYNYKNTLKEFLKRYNDKKEYEKKVGFLGELLVHIIAHELLIDYNVSSPFFNIEERNVKKGFDLVLNKKDTHELWITEVKSGSLHKDKNEHQTIKELINTAKLDLKKRLNDENVSLWLNAINGARVALTDESDEKKAILNILYDKSDLSNEGKLDASNMNVILVGALFHNIDNRFKEEEIEDKYSKIEKEKLFLDFRIIAIQKSTYEAIYNFLEEESNDA